ncbi:MAG: hypothetical protein ABI687_12965 [Flavitalea sp.]
MKSFNRRQFLGMSGILPLAASFGFSYPKKDNNCIFFTSQGKTAMINADGSGLKFFEFHEPRQATWQPSGFFPGGKKAVMMSMEPRRDGPGKPFEEYYTQTPTHIWSLDLQTEKLTELATRNRMSVFYIPSLLLPNNRLLVQVEKDRVSQVFSMNPDGSDAQPFTQRGEGVPYGLSLSPDARKVAFHLAGSDGYQVFTSDTDGKNRLKIRGNPGRLYFGPSWSPDSQWILYADCDETKDAGHDWADVCISRADASEHRSLTSGQAMWFAATYGNATTRGGGSNLPAWTRNGQVIFPQRLPGSKVPLEYQAERKDTDHFNRDFKPELSRGGVEIVQMNINSGHIQPLTPSGDGVWDFRASQSPDGKYVVFCRAETGGTPAIWIMDADGKNKRELTKGYKDLGADHPKWLPVVS